MQSVLYLRAQNSALSWFKAAQNMYDFFTYVVLIPDLIVTQQHYGRRCGFVANRAS
jgi:hypothetical protein